MEIQIGSKTFILNKNELDIDENFLLTKMQKYNDMNFSIKESSDEKIIFAENNELIFQEIILPLIKKDSKDEINMDSLVKKYMNKTIIDEYQDLIKIQEMFMIIDNELRFFCLPTITFENIDNKKIKMIFTYKIEIDRIINKINKKIIDSIGNEDEDEFMFDLIKNRWPKEPTIIKPIMDGRSFVFGISVDINFLYLYDIYNILYKCLSKFKSYEKISCLAYRRYYYDHSTFSIIISEEDDIEIKEILKREDDGSYHDQLVELVYSSVSYEISEKYYFTYSRLLRDLCDYELVEIDFFIVDET